MLDTLIYIGIGLFLYSYRNKDKFEFEKPSFWGVVLGWPIFLVITFFQAYRDVIKETK